MKNLVRISKFALVAVLVFTACVQPERRQPRKFKSGGRVEYKLTSNEERMLDSIQQKTFLFFLNEHHPAWGIVKDRTAGWAPASIAATGFGIPCFAIGVERKWITREQAAQITLNMLSFFTTPLKALPRMRPATKVSTIISWRWIPEGVRGTVNFLPWTLACS